MFGTIRNWLLGKPKKYQNHPEAIVIACYYNPGNSEYRLNAFKQWYDSIKHLNHRIIECVIGDSIPHLPENTNIHRVYTKSLLWHKETLLNKIIQELPHKFKYIFWSDTDLIFTNPNWMVDGVNVMKEKKIIQPFEWCVHLERDKKTPGFKTEEWKSRAFDSKNRHKRMWRSFCANHTMGISGHVNYDIHGHVGFIWGARRDVLKKMGLYDKALIGGADHIIAHAAAGQIPHQCITKSFTDTIDEVNEWSKKFYEEVGGSIGYVPGEVWHIWHGDLEKREYLKRIVEFTPLTKDIRTKDANGLYTTSDAQHDNYMKEYYVRREVMNPDSIDEFMNLDTSAENNNFS